MFAGDVTWQNACYMAVRDVRITGLSGDFALDGHRANPIHLRVSPSGGEEAVSCLCLEPITDRCLQPYLTQEKSSMSTIFKHRTRLGLTQQELGWRTGMSRSDVRRLERGDLQPSVRQLARLAHAFGIDVKELLPAFYPSRRSEETFDAMATDLKHAQSENERLRAQNERLQAENNDLMIRLTTLPRSGGRYQDHDMVKDLLSLIKLSHPDRHEGNALAVELTQALLTLKEKYEGRKAAW